MKSVRIVTKDNDGNDKVIIVRKPNHNQLTEAQLYSAKVFNKAKDAGACLRSKLNDFLIKEGVWSDDNQKRLNRLNDEITEKLHCLETGKTSEGKKLKLSEGKQLAIDIRNCRYDANQLLVKLRTNDAYTIEGQAENARFDMLVALCCFDEEGERIFSSIEDYYDKKEENYAVEAATKVASIVYELNENWEKELPENKFLIEYKFVDENLRYIDRQGRLVNINGELVDTEGNVLGAEAPKEQEKPEFENDVDN